jgi:hypothetical protein
LGPLGRSPGACGVPFGFCFAFALILFRFCFALALMWFAFALL